MRNSNIISKIWITYLVLVFIVVTIFDLDYKFVIVFQFAPLLILPFFMEMKKGFMTLCFTSLILNHLFPLGIVSLNSLFIPLLFFFSLDLQKIDKRSIFFPIFVIYSFIIIASMTSSVNIFNSIEWIISIVPYIFFYLVTRKIKHQSNIRFLNYGVIVFYFLILSWGFLYHLQFQIERLNGPLGNANITGGLMVLIIFHGIYFTIEHEIYRVVSLGLIFLAVIQLYLTKSRGAELGFIVGLFAMYWLYASKYKFRFKYILLFFTLLVGIIAITFIPSILGRFTAVNVSNFSLSEIDRLGVWYSAVQIFLKNPITGIGVNNFGEIYYQYHPFKDLMFLPKSHKMAHNVYLNMMAEHGILGLLFILGVTIYLFLIGFKMYRLSNTKKEINITIICIAFGMYYWVHNCFDMVWTTFGRHTMYFFFFGVMGIVDNHYAKLRMKQ